MQERAVKNLAQLADETLFRELATGMRLCLGNALRLWRGAAFLARRSQFQGSAILAAFVGEEAAKFHILLDAARCPRQPPDVFNRQLGYFNDHLAKGVYAQYYDWALVDFREVAEAIESERDQYYLDGPNGIDWIFRNRIERRREENIYVDYQVTDGRGYWHTPWDYFERGLGDAPSRPASLRLALILHEAGFDRPEAVAVVARKWRNVELSHQTHWSDIQKLNRETIEELCHQGLVRARAHVDEIVCEWLFPLYPLDLRRKKVDPASLREIQAQWSREW